MCLKPEEHDVKFNLFFLIGPSLHVVGVQVDSLVAVDVFLIGPVFTPLWVGPATSSSLSRVRFDGENLALIVLVQYIRGLGLEGSRLGGLFVSSALRMAIFGWVSFSVQLLCSVSLVGW